MTTGPTEAPEGQASPSARGRAAAQSLIEAHDQLRGELDQVRELVGEVVAGGSDIGSARQELQRLSLRRHDWVTGAFCSAHCLAVAQHHFGEDHEIFPVLARAQPALRPTLERLQNQHLTIHHLLEQIDAALVGLVAEPDGARRLTAVLDSFAEALTSHLSFEEESILDPMARVFG